MYKKLQCDKKSQWDKKSHCDKGTGTTLLPNCYGAARFMFDFFGYKSERNIKRCIF